MDIVAIISVVASAIAIVAASIHFLKWLFKSKTNDRPFIDVELEYVKGSSKPRGIGPNAVPEPGKDYFENATTLHLYQLKKEIKLTLFNNSEVTAYYPKYALHDDSPKILFQKLDNLTPIVPHGSITILGEFSEYEEALPKRRRRVEDFPSPHQRQQFKMLVEYQSSSRNKYYSEYSGDSETTTYPKQMPSNYNYTLESHGQIK